VSRQKKRRFADNLVRENVIEPGKSQYETIKGNWNKHYFKNDNPITIELGCGKGEYTIGLARHFQDKNFVGIDIKGDRIWVGSGIAESESLQNVAFLRTQLQFLPRFFQQNEVDEIWLTFPDPRPKDRDEKRRLTFPAYMELYKEVLKSDGWFRFKTDNTPLFDYTLELISESKIECKNLTYTHDLYHSDLLDEHYGIQTKYEKKFSSLGETIKYMKFQFL
jgi:tRNA (guanine-N7-)-methyltransferase